MKCFLSFVCILLSIPICLEGKICECEIVLGAERIESYEQQLTNKEVAVVVNHTSIIHEAHLVDVFLEKGISVKRIFAPEHGFRGDAAAGVSIKDSKDTKTGIKVVSLYGKKKKPLKEDLKGIDVVVFDIQDVGVRFYTYISTMHYVMDACAENGVEFIVLDRPNPNGYYVDGPILDTTRFRSFVGMHPIPVVHGLTVGELALMINGEGWLSGGRFCPLKVIQMENYHHECEYILPVKPSPNLPNVLSIQLYPQLCFFEATNISIGRGTDYPFQLYGFPDSTFGNYCFVPKEIPNIAHNPKQEGVKCYGAKFQNSNAVPSSLDLSLFIELYHKINDNDMFFSSERWFNLLIGNDWVLRMIKEGKSADEIRYVWLSELEDFKQLRSKYLLYP